MRLKLLCLALLVSVSNLTAQPAPVLPPEGPAPQPRPETKDDQTSPAERDPEAVPGAEAPPAGPPDGEAEAFPARPPAERPEPSGRLIPPEEFEMPKEAAPAPKPERDLACEAELREFGVVFERREPIDGAGACGVALPYNIREIAPGVRLRPDTEMTCDTALALARWLDRTVLPAVEALGEDVELTGLTHASTYVCRARNSRPGGKLSEHATGTAIDINSFDFKGREPIPVVPREGDGGMMEAFQRAVRAGACLYFTTVLGPGSDAYHDDHLHLDIAERSRGFRLCQ